MKAYIKEVKNSLWLIVDREQTELTLRRLDDIIERPEDTDNGVAYAILAEEVEAIRDACEEWLEQESQETMKESVKGGTK